MVCPYAAQKIRFQHKCKLKSRSSDVAEKPRDAPEFHHVNTWTKLELGLLCFDVVESVRFALLTQLTKCDGQTDRQTIAAAYIVLAQSEDSEKTAQPCCVCRSTATDWLMCIKNVKNLAMRTVDVLMFSRHDVISCLPFWIARTAAI